MRPPDPFSIGQTCKIKDAISCIDKGGAQIALVVNNSKLVGIVTDGDVRRALLKGFTLDSPVEQIMAKNYRFVDPSATATDALSLMQQETLFQMPVVEEKGKVVGLFLLEDLIKPSSFSNRVLIMAGGEGRRLLPLTQNCPKPMLLVSGKPMLEIIIEQCKSAGFKKFSIAVNYLKEQIINYFEDGNKWGIEIEYIIENKPLGTAGALGLIANTTTEPILMVNGDVLCRINYSRLLQFHEVNKVAGTLCVRDHRVQVPFGIIQTDGRRVRNIEEKPIIAHQVNAGIYVIGPSIIELVPEHQYMDIPCLINKAMKNGREIGAFPIHEYWIDVGRPDSLSQAHGEWF